MTKYWFKPPKSGYGMRPTTIEGWAVTGMLFFAILLIADHNGLFDETAGSREVVYFFIQMILLGVIFTTIVKDRVEGGLRWRVPIRKHFDKK